MFLATLQVEMAFGYSIGPLAVSCPSFTSRSVAITLDRGDDLI